MTPSFAPLALAAALCTACASTSRTSIAPGPTGGFAQEDPQAAPAEEEWKIGPVLDLAYVAQSDTDLGSDSGSFSVDRFLVAPGVGWGTSRNSAAVTFGYLRETYDFSPGSDLGAAPWETIEQVQANGFVGFGLGEKWWAFVAPSVRSAAERGASFSDGLQFGINTGARYEFDEKRKIGPGLGIWSQLEEDPTVFVFLVIDWEIAKRLTIETGRGLAATQGPGLLMRWNMSGKWDLIFGGRYERLRYRLDPNGAVPDGIGEETSIPFYLAAQRRFGFRSRVGVVAGTNLAGTLRLDNEGGSQLAEQDYDAAPFLGFFLTL